MLSDSDSSDGYEHIEQRLLSTAKFQLNQTPALQDDEIQRLKKELNQKLELIKQKRTDSISKISSLKSRRLQLNVALKDEKRKFQKSLLAEKREFSKQQEEIEVAFNEEMKSVTKEYSSMEISYVPKSPEEKLRDYTSQFGDSEEESSHLQPSQSQTELSILTNKVNSLIGMYEDKKEKNNETVNTSFSLLQEENTKSSNKIQQLEEEVRRRREELSQLKDKNRSNLAIIQNKIAKYDGKIRKTYDKYQATLSSSEIMHSSELDEENNATNRIAIQKLNDLKTKIQEKKERIQTLQEQIENSQAQHNENIESAKEAAYELKKQFKQINSSKQQNDNLVDTIKAAVARKNELEDKIAALDPILRKARDKHLQLQSTVNSLDFEINGRFGEHQRSYQLVQKKAHSQSSETSSSKRKKSNHSFSVNLDF